MKRVLVTGARGLIGKHVAPFLRDDGFQVHAVSRAAHAGDGVAWHRADLLVAADRERLFAEVRPDCLLHLAWDTRPGVYLDDDLNFVWLAASLDILRLLHQYGGKRAVLAGTCFEYEFAERSLHETDPIAPRSIYAKCKEHLNRLAALYCSKNDISYGWGRIFYVYGAGEQPGRLTPDVIRIVKAGERMIIRSGPLRRDYMYAKDVAAAFARFLAVPVEGEANICSSLAPTIEEYCRCLARKLGREDLLLFADHSSGQPPLIVGDNRRLREEIGFTPRHGLDDGFGAMLEEEKHG